MFSTFFSKLNEFFFTLLFPSRHAEIEKRQTVLQQLFRWFIHNEQICLILRAYEFQVSGKDIVNPDTPISPNDVVRLDNIQLRNRINSIQYCTVNQNTIAVGTKIYFVKNSIECVGVVIEIIGTDVYVSSINIKTSFADRAVRILRFGKQYDTPHYKILTNEEFSKHVKNKIGYDTVRL